MEMLYGIHLYIYIYIRERARAREREREREREVALVFFELNENLGRIVKYLY